MIVYARTSSALLTAVTYALTFLPAVVGGPLLAGLADRLPRRRLMVGTSLAQAVLVAGMAVPGTPLAVLLVLLVALNVLAAPFNAARAALVPDVTGHRYLVALVVDRTFQQTAQVVGFAGSGLLLLVSGPGVALLADAATFLASAALVHHGIVTRPPAHTGPPTTAEDVGGRGPGRRLRRAVTDARLGTATIRASRDARRAVLLTWLVAGFSIVPDGLAAPWARHLHGGDVLVALLLAANPAGNVLSGLWAGRWSRGDPGRRLAALAQLAVLPLAVCLADPPAAVVLGLLVASGVGTTVSLLARTVFVAHVPPEVRGRAFGVAGAGIAVSQGVALLLAGLAASHLAPATVTGLAGIVGSVAAVVLLAVTRPPRPAAP